MKRDNGIRVNYRFMSILAAVTGGVGILLQFTSLGDLTLFLALAVLGGLIGGRNDYEPRERFQFDRSFRTAFEWLILIMLMAYAFIVLSKWVFLIEGAVAFLNGHWTGLTISTMCLLMGLAGSRRTPAELPA